MVDLTKTIQDRLAELEDESAKLRKALEALNGTPQVKRTRTRRVRRPQGDPSDKLLGLVAEAPMSGSELADKAHLPYPATLRTLKRLEKDGRVRRVGERQGTHWHQVTTEGA